VCVCVRPCPQELPSLTCGAPHSRLPQVLAAHRCGLRPAVGYELNPWLLGLARFHAWRAGCAGSVCYRREDLWKVTWRVLDSSDSISYPQASSSGLGTMLTALGGPPPNTWEGWGPGRTNCLDPMFFSPFG
jgi:hypothetical protein